MQAPRSATIAHRGTWQTAQDALAARLQGLGARELGRVQVAHHAIAVRVDAGTLRRSAALRGVAPPPTAARR